MAVFASASSSRVKYEVFISFRGSDIRFGFLGHLTTALRGKQVDVYVDERLEGGDEISSALEEAIKGSKIALVIFSKDYASSTWCLNELVKIMECNEANGQIVLPVFYYVNPSDVRHQKGTYAESFAHLEQKFKDNLNQLPIWGCVLKIFAYLFGYHSFNDHEQRFKDNMGKLKIWRSVLKKTAGLSGYHSSNFQNESQLIDAIVQDVLKKLKDHNLVVPKSQLVGFDHNLDIVESLMKITSQEVRVLGIWGVGGIGKTTLARATFDKFSSQFESCCFLEKVREESTRIDGLSRLRQKLLSELLHLDKDVTIEEDGARRRLSWKKVLIVLDDVSDSKQLKDLAGQQLYLGLGSRVIVTSRDKHVFRSGEIHDEYIHEVKELNFEESLKLFSLHAFKQTHPSMGYEKLSEMTVAYATGIPLALEVLGSHFHSRDKAYWESELKKLRKYPRPKIQNILKVSYDELDDMDKEIFLDIAFFFIGEGKNHVTQVLEACGFRAISGIENLMDKALIKTNHDCKIVMHDLVQEMGEQIVREECSKYPELRSRLNDADEICDVLQRNMGTDKIEGIILDWNRINHLRLSPDTFTKMTNLRILKICHPWYSFEEKKNSKLFYYLGSFPNKLRYFHWDLYPLEFLPLEGYCFKNLVVLRMQHSNIKKLWDGVQDLVNLKMLDLRRSRQLMELPDFSRAHNLEEVYLSGCESLCSVHPSIFCLQSLVTLDVSHCEKSESLYHGSFPNKLRHFSWEQYPLESLPLGLCIKNLVELCIMDSNIKKLWDGVQDLMNLKTLSLSGCKQLVELPNFSMARNLEEVDLGGCESLHSVHPSILSLQSLVELNVSDCKELESLESETHLESLSYLGVEDCQSLKKFSVSSKKLDGLCFDGTEVEILHLLPMGGFTELRLLEIYGERLRSLPISELCSLTNLEGFQIWDFQQVIHTTELCSLFGAWRNLIKLRFERCSYLVEIPDNIKALTSLKIMILKDCERLKSILGLPPSLEYFNAEGCTSLENVFSDSIVENQCRFDFQNCIKLDECSLHFIEKLTHSSLTSACEAKWGGDISACYAGSRVPEWMEYKHQTEASNAIEFICNLKRSPTILCCCVVPPHPRLPYVERAHCYVSYDDNNKFRSSFVPYFNRKMKSARVYIWYLKSQRALLSARTGDVAKISCEFYADYRNDDFFNGEVAVPMKACGVHVTYNSQSDSDEERLPPIKETEK